MNGKFNLKIRPNQLQLRENETGKLCGNFENGNICIIGFVMNTRKILIKLILVNDN